MQCDDQAFEDREEDDPNPWFYDLTHLLHQGRHESLIAHVMNVVVVGLIVRLLVLSG